MINFKTFSPFVYIYRRSRPPPLQVRSVPPPEAERRGPPPPLQGGRPAVLPGLPQRPEALHHLHAVEEPGGGRRVRAGRRVGPLPGTYANI